jgi:hypothetical protein
MVRGWARQAVTGRPSPSSAREADGADDAPPRGRRRSELLVGAALVASGVLGSLWLQRTGAESVMVVGASQPLDASRPIGATDLVAVAVPRPIAGAFVPREEARDLVGGSVRAPVGSGAPIPRSLVAVQPVLGPDDVLVAALVDAGSYPPGLSPGDRVLVALAPDPTMLEARPPVLVEEPVVVWSVDRRDDGSGDAIVTLAATGRLALELAGAGSVRLAIVGAP